MALARPSLDLRNKADLGGQRGRLISVPDRLLCVELIREAQAMGSRLEPACIELGITLRTFQRWVREGDDAVAGDSRRTSVRPEPANKLSEDERAEILAVPNSEEFASLPPSQIVPALADRGVYVASESSFYRVLKAASQQHHRGRRKEAFRTRAYEPLRHRPEPGVELGYYVDASCREGPILLLAHGA